ncbi:RNA methyltransferase, partial [Gardnerella vaginalis]
MQVTGKEDKSKEDKSMQDAQNPVNRVEQMYEYGYRKSNYGPDELVTD